MKKLMKKLLIILLILFFAVPAMAEIPFYNANQVTLGWNEVTTDVDGDAVPGISYKVYLVNAVTDPNKINPAVVAEPTTNQVILTLSKGKFFVGVSAVYLGNESGITWADTQDTSEGAEQFGLRFAVPPKDPKNIVRQ